MNEEKRKGDKAVPEGAESYLNTAQLSELHKIESFGWTIKYLRHPLFQDPVVIVSNADGSSIGVLEEDGRLNLDPGIEVRD